MFIATLLTHPTGALDPNMIGTLRNRFGGGNITWLNPKSAAEFTMSASPPNHDNVWQSLQGQEIDFVVQPAGNRRKKLLLADMDSTMIGQECIDELAATAGVGDQVKAITARAMDGALNFEDALRARVALLKGAPADIIADVLNRRITPVSGGATLVATMKAHGAYTALVSGGFTAFTAWVAQTLGFDDHRANTLLIENNVLMGDVARPILGRAAKVEALADSTNRLSIGAHDVLAIGDGANDLGMIEHAGLGVAVHAKPIVQAQAQHRINHGDLTALLYIQGYHMAEFVNP